jgi:predicted Zn-dependent protease
VPIDVENVNPLDAAARADTLDKRVSERNAQAKAATPAAAQQAAAQAEASAVGGRLTEIWAFFDPASFSCKLEEPYRLLYDKEIY